MEQILAYGILENRYVEINKQAVLPAIGQSPFVEYWLVVFWF